MITLRQIQFALAVARHKHFKRAAEECNISQSALSLGIAEMEKNLGVIVFERNNKQVVITPIGEELLRRAEKIHLDAQQLVEQAHASQDTLHFPMAIGFIPTIAPFFLPQALPVIHKAYPKFEMNIREDVSERLVSAVHHGMLDAALIALPYDIVEICKFRNQISPHSFREASLNTLVQMVVNDMGLTLVPEMALPSLHRLPDIRTIPLDVPAPHRRLALVTRPNYPRTVELEALMGLFRDALNNIRAAIPAA